MAKFSPAENIPADMEALAFWEDSHGNTQYQFSKSVRGAKLVSARHPEGASWGWRSIEPSERSVMGIMIW